MLPYLEKDDDAELACQLSENGWTQQPRGTKPSISPSKGATIAPQDIDKIWEWNKTVPAPVNRCIHNIIEERVKAQPTAPAICAWDGELTYGDLDQLSIQVANKLSRAGVVPGALVPLCFEKSKWTTVAMLGVLKAGAGCVVLDSSLPEYRLQTIVQQVNAALILSSAPTRDLSRRLSKEVIVIDPDFFTDMDDGVSIQSNFHDPESVVYVIFTSGSTGSPKGVLITHTNVSSAVHYQAKRLGFSKKSRLFDFPSYSHDVCISNSLATLASGGCLCVPSDQDRKSQIPQSISRLRANVVALTPSIAQFLSPDDVPGLQRIIFVGEALDRTVVGRWWDKVQVVQRYGVSECPASSTINCSASTPEEALNIGKGAGLVTWIVDPDSHDTLLSPGLTGELLLEGPLISYGYLNDLQGTAAAYIETPAWLSRGAPRCPGRRGRLYKTGDLVHYNENGSLTYVGRKDTQVKIRGQRVELGEVEYRAQECILEARQIVAEVILPQGNDSAPTLCLFVAANDQLVDFQQVDTEVVRVLPISTQVEHYLARHLPSYMIPKIFFMIKNVPMTATGKLNRRRLREIGGSFSAKRLAAMLTAGQDKKRQPITRQEKELQSIWACVLGIEPCDIGLDDSFLQLGGDSISAMKVVQKAHGAGLRLTVVDLLRHPRLVALASRCLYVEQGALENIPPFSLLEGGIDSASLLRDIWGQSHSIVIQDAYPCTPLQEGLMSLSLRHPGDYILQRILELPSDIDVAKFCDAWEKVTYRMEILRTRIIPNNNKFGMLQVVVDETIHWIKASGLESYLEVDRRVPMETGGPLVRYALVSDETGSCRWFVWTIHHALCDGWSMTLIADAVSRVYQGKAEKFSLPFKAFIRYIRDQDHEKAVNYWREALISCNCELFPALPGSIQQPVADEWLEHRFQWSHEPLFDITTSALIRAAWALVAGSQTNSDEIGFGVTVSGRSAPVVGIDEMAAPTIATLPILIKLDKGQRVLDYLREVQRQATDMIAFEQFGLHQIAKVTPDCQRACMFQTLLVVQPPAVGDTPGTIGKWIGKVQEDQVNTYALLVEIQPGVGTMAAKATFNSNIVGPWMIRRMLERLEFVMCQLSTSTPEKKIAEVEMITQQDHRDIWNSAIPRRVEQVVHGLTDTRTPFVRATLHDLISHQASATPDREALFSTTVSMSYAELDRISTRFANHLYELGVRSEWVVPFCFEKSLWAVVAMIGVMKAGGAFVPLDPSYPASRHRALMKEVDARFLIVSPSTAGVFSDGPVTNIVELSPTLLSQIPETNESILKPNEMASPANTAYILFTSGSTGKPKGVVVPHSSICTSIIGQTETLKIGSTTRFLQFGSWVFDACIGEIFATLASGGTVCIPSDSERAYTVADFMTRARVNIAMLTPSFMKTLAPKDVPTLETLVLIGEAPSSDLLETWHGRLRLLNGYGPTETCVICSFHTYQSPTESARIIGRGVVHSGWIVDPENHNRLMPFGCVGELLVQSHALARGYFNDEEKTKYSFINNVDWISPEFSLSKNHQRFYKTGDLVRYNDNGFIHYLGRKDTQVKIRGQRIELEEVEYQISKNLRPAAEHVVVDTIRHSSRETLIAFICFPGYSKIRPSDAAHGVRLIDMSDGLRECFSELIKNITRILPDHMIPKYLAPVERMPRNASGKLDRKALLEHVSDMPTEKMCTYMTNKQRCFKECSNDLEHWIRTQWSNLLHVPENFISVYDNFYDLGGDSILIVSLSKHIFNQYKIRLPISMFNSRHTTVSSIAKYVERMQNGMLHDVAPSLDLMSKISSITNTSWAKVPQGLISNPTTTLRDQATVLLTGATGYLGTEILRQLLRSEMIGHVVTVVRAKSADHGLERIKETARNAGWWQDRDEAKVEVWPGDISKIHLGLNDDQWSRLQKKGHDQIDAFIHNGAIVNWNADYDKLAAVNVNSTAELLRIASGSLPHPKFVFVSGGMVNYPDFDRNGICAELRKSTGYIQTKYVAECFIQDVYRKLPSTQNRVSIVKPGRIIGTASTGVANRDDFVWRMVATAVAIKFYPQETYDTWVYMDDVGAVASTIIAQIRLPGAVVPFLHTACGLPVSDFWEQVNHELKVPCTPLPWEVWVKLAEESMNAVGENHPLWPVQHFIEHLGSPKMAGEVYNGDLSSIKMALRSNVRYLLDIGFINS